MWNKLVGSLLLGILVWPNLGCNGIFCFSSAPAPFVSSITPNPVSAVALQSDGFFFISGTNFVPTSVVIINGVNHPTTFMNGGQLRVTLFPGEMHPGNLNVVVRNPATFGNGFCGGNGGVSGVVAFSSS